MKTHDEAAFDNYIEQFNALENRVVSLESRLARVEKVLPGLRSSSEEEISGELMGVRASFDDLLRAKFNLGYVIFYADGRGIQGHPAESRIPLDWSLGLRLGQ